MLGRIFRYRRNCYSRITSTKSQSSCMSTYSSSLTNLTVLLPQSHDCSYYVSRKTLVPFTPSDCRNTLIYGHANLHNLPTCDISLCSLKLPTPEAGDLWNDPAITAGGRKLHDEELREFYSFLTFQNHVVKKSDTARTRSRRGPR
jgi:hypothetical protein